MTSNISMQELVSSPGKVLFLLAHCDDEFFVLPRIEREVALGSDVYIVFTTDGAAYKVSPQVRLDESLTVLKKFGVIPENVFALGTELGVKDGASFRYMDTLWTGLEKKFQSIPLDRIYAMAWEGGHVDHDVAHLLGIALRKKFPGALLFEFSAYHSKGLPGPLIRSMSLIPNHWPLLIDTVSPKKALSWFLNAWQYKTQVKTFLGLSPLFAFQVLGRRSAVCRLVDSYDYRRPPHSGRLMYEKRFKVPFQVFSEAVSEFVEYLKEG